jgi:hypothetical protein
MIAEEIRKDLSKPKQIFEQWRDAHRHAHALEEELAAAWQGHLDNDGEPPSADLIRAVWGARSQANEKLITALVEMSIETRSHP